MPGEWNHLTTTGEPRYRVVWKREGIDYVERMVFSSYVEASAQFGCLLDQTNVQWVRIEEFKALAHTVRPGVDPNE